MNEKPTVVVISGPTASGKSRVAVELAKSIAGEIISADSVQIFKGFNIGSATPAEDEMAGVPHHLLSSLEPEERIDAGSFCRLATEAIDSIVARGKLPIVVGGTGLYIRSLLCGLVDIAPPSEEIRNHVANRFAEAENTAALHEWLAELDPETAARLKVTDNARIRRALEVVLAHGVSLAALHDEHKNQERPFRALVIVLLPEREKLYEKINARVDAMFADGLLEEVRELCEKHKAEAQAFSTIGYRHVLGHLEGGANFDEMLETLKMDTRRFAKRQLTWWRNQPQKLSWQELNAQNNWDLDSLPICDISSRLSPAITEILQQRTSLLDKEVCYLRVGVALT